MRHRVAGRKLGRKTNHRIAMWRNMAVALFTHGQITTTVPKAKSVQPFVEKLISAARRGDLASRRRVIAELGGNKNMVAEEDADGVERNRYGELKKAPKVVQHLFDEIAPRYADRPGGYTRIVRLGSHRLGDGADLCVLQLVSDEDTGPQVAGRHSRRREKANRRMERAAALRKGARGGAAAVDEAEPTEADAALAQTAEDAEQAPGADTATTVEQSSAETPDAAPSPDEAVDSDATPDDEGTKNE